jgi:hypothetical protein
LVVWKIDIPDLDLSNAESGDRSSEAPEPERQLV